MFYLGIDQHAKQLTVNLRDADGKAILKRQVSTRPEKVLEFFEQLTARCAQEGCWFWAIVEVCGLIVPEKRKSLWFIAMLTVS